MNLLENTYILATELSMTDRSIHPCEQFKYDKFGSLTLTTWDESHHNGDVISGSYKTMKNYDIPEAKLQKLYDALRAEFIRGRRMRQEEKWLRRVGIEE